MDQACALILKKTGAAPTNLHTIGKIYEYVRTTASTAEKTIALLGDKKAFDPDPEARRAIEVLQKCQSTISGSIELGKKLGAGFFGTVYNTIQTVLGRTIEFVKKVFNTTKKCSLKDAVHEFLIYYTLRRRIAKHSHEIASDPSLAEGANRLPMLALTKEQEKFLAKASSPEDLEGRIQILMQKNGIYLEKKPGKSLQSCLKNDSVLGEYLSRRNPQPTKIFKLFGDVCMGLAAADRFHIVHRDLHEGNIQIDIKNCDAYILDFGVAVDVGSKVQKGEQRLDIINGESPICAPQEAFSADYEYSTEDHVDKYNSFGASPIGLQLFFGQEGYKIVDDYLWTYKKYAKSPEGKKDKKFQQLYKEGKLHSDNPNLINAIKWSRDHFHKDIATNVKAANEALKGKGFAGYTDEQCEKVVELLSGLSHPNPKKRMTAAEAAKNLFSWMNLENTSQEEPCHGDGKPNTKIFKPQNTENREVSSKKHQHNRQKRARGVQNETNEQTKVNPEPQNRKKKFSNIRSEEPRTHNRNSDKINTKTSEPQNIEDKKKSIEEDEDDIEEMMAYWNSKP